MYMNILSDTTAPAARFRTPVLCTGTVSAAFTEGRRIAGDVSFELFSTVHASFKGAEGVRAWSPPV